MSLLDARNLSVTADLDRETVPVLRNLSFSLEPGKVLGLVGESGAGKSMVGRAISQLLPPHFRVSGGSLTFRGEDLVAMPSSRRRQLLGESIAFIPQEPMTALNPVRSIGDQFGEHLKRLGVRGRAERRRHVIGHLEDVYLPDPEGLLEKYPHQLSGGMCQRVLIAMAFASDPPLIVADEPTTALDVTIQARIMQLIIEMKAAHGTAVIFITHDLKLAAHVCDDIAVMYAGGIVESGPAKTLFSDPVHPYTRSLHFASPALSGPRRALYNLPDHMPGLTALVGFGGCRFAPRCPIVEEACRRDDPAQIEIASGHCVACRLTARAAEVREPAAKTEATGSDATHAEPIVCVENLWKRYAGRRSLFGPDSREVIALRDVSFELYPNEFVAIVGESGSGKSTVAKLIMGLERPTRGRILVGGHDVADEDRQNRAARIKTVQMVFQDPQSALNPRRRVVSIVTQAMEAGDQTVTRQERLAWAREILASIAMPSDTAERYPVQLSGGQRQRVNIARALCVAPQVLVADEIVSGLDVSVQAQLLDLLLRLKEELKVALLFISHDLSVVRHLCSRVMVLHQGEIVESGPINEVFENPQHAYTRTLLSAVPPDDANRVWEA
jgi:peptide/nickel transport system ATP-binding protein